jgi:hypothetical protein
MFDSPFEYCPLCGEVVLLDQTRRECAAEHNCGRVECPLARFFTGIDFTRGQTGCAKPVKHEKRK